MGIEELKFNIKEKFGSITKFAELVKVERYDLQKFFAAAEKKMTPERQQYLDTLGKLVKFTKVKPLPSELDGPIRKKIAKAIEDFGGVEYFCQENPRFNPTSVRHIINGTRKRINNSVKSLLTHLKITINGESNTEAEAS